MWIWFKRGKTMNDYIIILIGFIVLIIFAPIVKYLFVTLPELRNMKRRKAMKENLHKLVVLK